MGVSSGLEVEELNAHLLDQGSFPNRSHIFCGGWRRFRSVPAEVECSNVTVGPELPNIQPRARRIPNTFFTHLFVSRDRRSCYGGRYRLGGHTFAFRNVWPQRGRTSLRRLASAKSPPAGVACPFIFGDLGLPLAVGWSFCWFCGTA